MAFDEHLADRIRHILDTKKIHYSEKKMMGGLTFMVDDKMCIGIVKEELMCRINPEQHEEAISKNGVRTMDFTKRKMRGYVFVAPEVVDMEADLNFWIELCLAYNPMAKSSKKK